MAKFSCVIGGWLLVDQEWPTLDKFCTVSYEGQCRDYFCCTSISIAALRVTLEW